MTFKFLPRPDAAALPAEVSPQPMPRLYVYEHCPFCVRARYVLNMKSVRYTTVWLMNDDFATPEALTGKKMLPILEASGLPGGARAMGESLDICAHVDADPAYGPPGRFRPASDRADIDTVVAKLMPVFWRLCFPRIANTAEFPELATQSARDWFVKRHPFSQPPHDYQTNVDNTDAYLKIVNDALPELDACVFSAECVTEGGLSFDDVTLFPKLRSLTGVKGIVWPQKIRAYMEYQALQSEIYLLDKIAM